MKIAAIRTYLLDAADSPDGSARVKPFLFVKIETEAGIEAFSVAVSPHNYNSTTLAMAAMLHAAALMPNLLTAEIYPDYLARGASFAEVDFEIRDGAATLPQAPGLGVRIDEEALIALTEGARALP